MIVRWPGRVPANAASDAIWSWVDVHATLAQLARAPADGIDGISALPILLR